MRSTCCEVYFLTCLEESEKPGESFSHWWNWPVLVWRNKLFEKAGLFVGNVLGLVLEAIFSVY